MLRPGRGRRGGGGGDGSTTGSGGVGSKTGSGSGATATATATRAGRSIGVGANVRAGGEASTLRSQTAAHPLKRPRQTAPHIAHPHDVLPATIGWEHPSWICGPNS